jgi:PEGA domain/Tetratricopeptide repeat
MQRNKFTNRQRACALTLCMSVFFLCTKALASDGSGTKEAGTRFQRAVTLYNEADYRGALSEFKRAYEISPNVNVLYNIGQAYYQLQDYGNALTTFERYLTEGGTTRKTEVEASLSVLRTRVGRLEVVTPLVGAEVLIDDEPVGKTPLSKSLLVSVGKHRVSLAQSGAPTLSRVFEAVAGETKSLVLVSESAAKPVPPSASNAPSKDVANGSSKNPATIGWIVTGALGAGCTVTGVLAFSSANKLKDARAAYGSSRADLDSRASTTTALSLVTDGLLIGTVAMGALSLYWTLSGSSNAASSKASLAISPGHMTYLVQF